MPRGIRGVHYESYITQDIKKMINQQILNQQNIEFQTWRQNNNPRDNREHQRRRTNNNPRDNREINRHTIYNNAINFERNLKIRKNRRDYMNMELIETLRLQNTDIKIKEACFEIRDILEILRREIYWTGPLGAEFLPPTNENKCVSCGMAINFLENNNIGRLSTILNSLFENAHDEKEIEQIDRIKEILLEINPIENKYYDVFLNNRNKFVLINFINNQFRSFYSFCDNQNNYDNMISIIKILQRTKQHTGLEIKINYKFLKENHENFYDIEKYIKEECIKQIQGIRFLL